MSNISPRKSPGLFYCLIYSAELECRQEVNIVTIAETEKVKAELFKTILSNPANCINSINSDHAIDTVRKMIEAISNPKFGIKTSEKE